MATESQFPRVDIPEIDIFEFLLEQKRDFPDDKAIYVDDKSSKIYTLASVKQTSIAFGSALRSLWNWNKGDVMCWYTPNCVDIPALSLGILWAGGVVSPANPAYTASELAFQLRDSGSKALLAHARGLKTAILAAEKAKIPLNRILIIGDGKVSKPQHVFDFINSSRDIPVPSRVVSAPQDLAYLVYSSGTTGLPKGVMLTHQNIIANTLQTSIAQTDLSLERGPNGQGDTILAVLPIFHIYGLGMFIHHSLFIGVKVVFTPAFEPESFCRTIQEHKITFIYVVPPIILFLSKSPIVQKFDLSSIKALVSAAAPLTTELIEAVWNRLRIPVKQAYGLSETSPSMALQSLKEWRAKMGSVGRIVSNSSIKIISDTGEALEAGVTGELCVKGPHIFAGYLNNPEATAKSMTSDGYFKTGDIGFLDSDHHLYITDRVKELIKYKGFQVAPASLEGLLLGHEKVADVCVLGVYDPNQATELPRAYIVKSESAKKIDDVALEKEIKEWMHDKVASHKRLRGGIRFVDSIPKSAAGKILRRILRDKAKAEEEIATKSKL